MPRQHASPGVWPLRSRAKPAPDVRKRALEALHKAGKAVATVEGLAEWNQHGFDILVTTQARRRAGRR